METSENHEQGLSGLLQIDGNPVSACLDELLPQRGRIVDAWQDELAQSPYSTTSYPEYLKSRDIGQTVGTAFETAVGLDLATDPSRIRLLHVLPASSYEQVVTDMGFNTVGSFTPESTDMVGDPLLNEWHKGLVGSEAPSELGRVAGHLVLATLYRPPDRPGDEVASVDRARNVHQFLQSMEKQHVVHDDCGNPHDVESESFDQAVSALETLWSRYLDVGRSALGVPVDGVYVNPEFARGFAYGDMIIGSSIVDIKVVGQPKYDISRYFDQVLMYALLDKWNAYELESVSLYYAWHAVKLQAKLEDILEAGSDGPTPSLAEARDYVQQQLGKTLLGAERSYLRRSAGYPWTNIPLNQVKAGMSSSNVGPQITDMRTS